MKRLFALLLLTGVATTSAADDLRPHERWIWTELIGFDNRQPDLGADQYIRQAGFTPTAICLLLGSPDFFLSHAGIDRPQPLPPECCSRDGHEFNRERSRQVWTNHQLRSLVQNLRRHGVQVYASTFTRFFRNRSHREWLADHPEVFQVWRTKGFAWSLNPLARLNDGGYFQDFFARQVVAVLQDYGFDGWHGPDGWGPLNGPIYENSFSDDMAGQFAAHTQLELPVTVTQVCANDLEKLQARGDWIWQHARRDWIDFYADRWAGFWRTMAGAAHQAGKKVVINSAWGRAPFESLYRYGIDYRKIVDAGVDGIIVETAAAGLAMDPRLGGGDMHDHFLSMLMLIKAYVPDAKLIFLHNVHDVVEQWDALRHAPALLEREIHALANVFYADPQGRCRPCADGFVVCLGDAIHRDEWAWLCDKWKLAFCAPPHRTLGATLLWSDAALRNELDAFISTRLRFTDRLLAELMAAGAPVQAVARTRELQQLSGPLLVLNPQLFPAAELAEVLAYDRGPIITVGGKFPSMPTAGLEFCDAGPANPVWCGVYRSSYQAQVNIEPSQVPAEEVDPAKASDPRGYWDALPARPASLGFQQACAAAIIGAAGRFTVTQDADRVSLMIQEQDDGTLRMAIKNRTTTYARPQVDLLRPIERVDVLTSFPSVLIRPEGSKFTVRVPGRGVTVLAVKLAPKQ